MSDYEDELRRFLAGWDLQRRDAEISADKQQVAEAQAIEKLMTILVEQLGYSKDDALRRIKSTGRFSTYFTNSSD